MVAEIGNSLGSDRAQDEVAHINIRVLAQQGQVSHSVLEVENAEITEASDLLLCEELLQSLPRVCLRTVFVSQEDMVQFN